MTETTTMDIRCVRYELEIPIDAPRDRVWRSLTEEIDAWWLPDFHMVGAGSRLTLDAHAGGHLIEHLEGGGSLLWFTVSWCSPGEVLHAFGHVAPDWGGPATTTIKIAIEERDGGCVVKFSDATFGHVSDSNVASLQDGWLQLFRDGLKKHVEA